MTKYNCIIEQLSKRVCIFCSYSGIKIKTITYVVRRYFCEGLKSMGKWKLWLEEFAWEIRMLCCVGTHSLWIMMVGGQLFLVVLKSTPLPPLLLKLKSQFFLAFIVIYECHFTKFITLHFIWYILLLVRKCRAHSSNKFGGKLYFKVEVKMKKYLFGVH